MNICRIIHGRQWSAALVAGLFLSLFSYAGDVRTQPQPAASTSTVIRFWDGENDPCIRAKQMTVEIGDSTKHSFDPSFTITAWQNECRFKLNLSTSEYPLSTATRSVSSANGKPRVELVTPAVEHDMYAHPGTGFEWEIILKQKPDTNVFTYSIETEGLRFYYQDTLTDYEKDSMQAERPDSVVGSYAVYHATRANNRRVINGADTTFENYLTGKAFHIFRPRAWDAAGTDTVWCDLHIDSKAGALSLTVPSGFLDHAIYPVTIDPTFGKTVIGGSNGNIGTTTAYAHRLAAQHYQASTGDNVDTLCYYTHTISDATIKMAVYTITSNTPETRKGITGAIAVSGTTPQWYKGAVDISLLNLETYGCAVGDMTDGPCKWYFDAVTLGTSYDLSGLVPNYYEDGSLGYAHSLYAVYSSYEGTARRRHLIAGDN